MELHEYLHGERQSGTTIVWKNLTVTVKPRGSTFTRRLYRKFAGRPALRTNEILRGASGYAVSGNLIAVMGPSGAGKTTFLAALAKRIPTETGSVTINGQVLQREIVSKISSYVPQFDALPTSLTPEEYMLFVCALKMRSTHSQRKFLSHKLLMDLGLYDCKDTRISRLSGGQRKRLSLATELVARPRILFLDEPTTGLDTFSATRVVESLRFISSGDTLVFCTIHQPGMAIYDLFDRVILMAAGRIVYSGTLDNAREFFSSLGYDRPASFDESEYYVKLLSTEAPESTEDSREENFSTSTERVEKISRAFQRSEHSTIPEFNVEQLDIVVNEKPGWLTELLWLSWRICLQNRRNVLSNWFTWMSYSLSVIAVCTFYWGINPRTQEGVQSSRGALYMMSSEIIFTVAYSVIYEFPGELLVYTRENGAYGCLSYYIATFLGLMPRITVKAVIFTSLMFLVLNTEADVGRYSLLCVSTIFAAICGTAYGLMFSSWIVDVEIATTIMIPIDLLFMLTAGVFYNLRSLPSYLNCLKYTSTFFYTNEALSIIYWRGIDKIECQANGDLPCLSNGRDVLLEYGYQETNFYWDLGGLASLTILMNLLGYLGLLRRRMTEVVH